LFYRELVNDTNHYQFHYYLEKGNGFYFQMANLNLKFKFLLELVKEVL